MAGLSSWSINGSLAPSSEFLLDGAPNDMIYQAAHSISYIPPVDAVEEFKVVTGAYDAQYGRNGGGVVSVAIKSGTNRLHGSAYEFLKRPFLDANSFANNANGAARELRQTGPVGLHCRRPGLAPEGLQRARTGPSFLWPTRSIATIPSRAAALHPCPRRRSAAAISRTPSTVPGQLMPIYDPATGRTVNGNLGARSRSRAI